MKSMFLHTLRNKNRTNVCPKCYSKNKHIHKFNTMQSKGEHQIWETKFAVKLSSEHHTQHTDTHNITQVLSTVSVSRGT